MGGHGGCRKVQGEHKWGNEGGRGGVEEDGCRSVPSDNSASLGGGGGGAEGRNVSSQQAGVVTSECQTNKLLTLTNTSAARGYS